MGLNIQYTKELYFYYLDPISQPHCIFPGTNITAFGHIHRNTGKLGHNVFTWHSLGAIADLLSVYRVVSTNNRLIYCPKELTCIVGILISIWYGKELLQCWLIYQPVETVVLILIEDITFIKFNRMNPLNEGTKKLLNAPWTEPDRKVWSISIFIAVWSNNRNNPNKLTTNICNKNQATHLKKSKPIFYSSRLQAVKLFPFQVFLFPLRHNMRFIWSIRSREQAAKGSTPSFSFRNNEELA